MRYYLGVDWADQTHAVWVVDEQGAKVASRAVPPTAAGLSEWGRGLDEWRAPGMERGGGVERARKVGGRAVPPPAAGLSEWGRELDEWRAQGIELWAAMERPEGRVVDCLVDHGGGG